MIRSIPLYAFDTWDTTKKGVKIIFFRKRNLKHGSNGVKLKLNWGGKKLFLITHHFLHYTWLHIFYAAYLFYWVRLPRRRNTTSTTDLDPLKKRVGSPLL